MPDSMNPQEKFLQLAQQAGSDGSLVRITLGKYRGNEPDLQRIQVRPVQLRNALQWSFVFSYKTRDITKNHPPEEAVDKLGELLPDFHDAYLFTTTAEHRLETSRKGKQQLHSHNTGTTAPEADRQGSLQHNREKQRFVEVERPYLHNLGITDEKHRVIPAMAHKWKQINKFVELFDQAFSEAGLGSKEAVQVVDFGCGKGYLTFAVHDYLRHTLHNAATVTGVELRQPLVDLCNVTAAQLSEPGLQFVCGDVRTHAPQQIDVMIALHACDTATDYAIHYGIRAGAGIIMCSPCCHKQIRPQMQAPAVLKGLLQYGVHMGQEAEMVTDALRALLLEAHGYTTRVFEFISLEHTSKNKMILAVKQHKPGNNKEALERVAALKAFYGIREHCLETLLQSPPQPLQG